MVLSPNSIILTCNNVWKLDLSVVFDSSLGYEITTRDIVYLSPEMLGLYLYRINVRLDLYKSLVFSLGIIGL